MDCFMLFPLGPGFEHFLLILLIQDYANSYMPINLISRIVKPGLNTHILTQVLLLLSYNVLCFL